jgi:hypothetical protein
MKKLFAILFVLTFLIPLSTSANEVAEDTTSWRGFDVLSGNELSDGELKEIVGQGLHASSPDRIERTYSKIILWDEAKGGIVRISLSIGHENLQRNTLSVQGR